MPSSKRARIVPTSKTRKNHKDLVRRLASNIQSAASTYSYIYVFSVQNMRNSFLKSVRTDLGDSRIFMGKTKVMTVALGRDVGSECVPGVSGLGEYMKGEIGLLFSDRGVEEVQRYFAGYSSLDYARSGAVASRGCVVPQGEIWTMYGVGVEEEPLPMSIESTLRKLGVPTRIVKGKIVLEEGNVEDGMVEEGEDGYVVCKEGDVLDSRQTSILKILGVRMAEFKMDLIAVYDKSRESVRQVGAMEVDEVVT